MSASPQDLLKKAITSVDWNANVAAFLASSDAATKLVAANMKIAVWCKQFETADSGNPALVFLRGMQASGHHVAALIPLGLYQAAAGSMRAVVENALYYSYFRTHPAELQTLAKGDGYFIDKSEIIAFHKMHTDEFQKLQTKLGLITSLNDWYSRVSGIVHGQMPGKWVKHISIDKIKFDEETAAVATGTFGEGVDVAHKLFLCTVGRLLWDGFSTSAKKSLLHGLSGDAKTILGLDSA